MKTALTGISALSDGVVAELYTITLKNGTVLYYTTADIDLPYRGQTYLAGKFNLERTPVMTSVGVNVDEVTVTVYPNDGDLLLGMPLPKFTLNGGFDNAWVKIERARNAYVTPLFEGMVSAAPKQDRFKIDLVISSPLILLDVEMPRNSYNSGCIHKLYGSGYGLDKSLFAYFFEITSATSNGLNVVNPYADGYFNLGTIEFTTGANTGQVRTIRKYVTNHFDLSYPLPSTPVAGDTFTAYPGCDKLVTTCTNFFSNIGRYRGYPFIPTPEASI